jgi:hypothetical protein
MLAEMKFFLRKLVLYLVPLPLFCGDIAVLVDVSGTMKQYGAWQNAAISLVESTLDGKSVPTEDWQTSGPQVGLSQFRLGTGERLYVMKFGSIVSPKFPFFEPAERLDSAKQLRDHFPLNGSAYTQVRTNTSLARAVGTLLSAGAGTEARLIVISDFLVDSNLDSAEISFVNDVETGAKIEEPVILSWRENPKVQIKMMNVTLKPKGPPQGDQAEEAVAIRLIPLRILDNPKRAQFQWAVDSKLAPKRFEVVVRDAGTHKEEWRQSAMVGSAVWSDPKPGRKSWQVSAVMENDQVATSQAAIAEIPGSSGGAIVLLLLAILGAGYGIYRFADRRKTTPVPLNREES